MNMEMGFNKFLLHIEDDDPEHEGPKMVNMFHVIDMEKADRYRHVKSNNGGTDTTQHIYYGIVLYIGTHPLEILFENKEKRDAIYDEIIKKYIHVMK